MGGRHISVEEGRAVAAEVLEKAGLTADEAAAVADIVVWTELTGYPQIGLARLPRLAEYVRRVDRVPIRVERDGPFSAHLEAGRALGYVTALRMVEVCAEKVRATGVGIVTANGSGLTGRNAYYVERLAEQGWVALMVNNFPAVVAPHGSSEALFGTNPLSVAMPTSGPPARRRHQRRVAHRRRPALPPARGPAAARGAGVRRGGQRHDRRRRRARRGGEGVRRAPRLGARARDPGVRRARRAARRCPRSPTTRASSSWRSSRPSSAIRTTSGAASAELLERVRGARPADPDVPVRAPNDRALASMEAVRARGIAVSDELADALEALR